MKTVTEIHLWEKHAEMLPDMLRLKADADYADGNANANSGKHADRPAGAAASSPMSESAAYSDEALSALLAWETRTGVRIFIMQCLQPSSTSPECFLMPTSNVSSQVSIGGSHRASFLCLQALKILRKKAR